ncbi:MAG: tetraacyldisaccharide 4'-kinase [Nitrospinae bacterium]|nr:tetraacyldisaccharide 4'-kinase [Nitrospinota bacterium]
MLSAMENEITQKLQLLRNRLEAIMRGAESAGRWHKPLMALSTLYGSTMTARNRLYDKGTLKTGRAPSAVISVGNITMGGSGKTPLVELICRKLSGHKTGILSRGYGGSAPGPFYMVGGPEGILGEPPPISADEPYMLARRLPGVVVACAPNRLYGARKMAEKYGVDTIILDDGFQRRSIARDLDILAHDAFTPLASNFVFPRGTLREPLDGINRAGIIVITAPDGAPETIISQAVDEVRSLAPGKPVAVALGSIAGFKSLNGQQSVNVNGPALAFCGVGAPERFKMSLEKTGVKVSEFITFPDHHKYQVGDIELIRKAAADMEAEFIVTTEKDAVRLIRFMGALASMPVCYAEYGLRITRGESELNAALAGALKGATGAG